ncbi:MAG: nucleotide sugar dehydrogenase, partial [Candidatus Sericytochromatia bacterium]
MTTILPLDTRNETLDDTLNALSLDIGVSIEPEIEPEIEPRSEGLPMPQAIYDRQPDPVLDQTLERLRTREACIAVMGLGYVGLPLLEAFYQSGFAVLGFDPDPRKLAALRTGSSYIQDVPDAAVATMAHDARARFSAEEVELGSADAILICVPTPLHKSKEPDLSFILAAAEAIARQLRPGQLVILESTTYPGTTDEILLPMFEARGLRVGVDFMLAFSPERIDPGNRRYAVADIPKVVGGLTPRCSEAATALYGSIITTVHPVSSPRVAETAKILENTFRSVNIALVNEFASICRTLGVDVWEVIDAAATKPFGFMKFVPGPGIGGHCIPLDPHYLIWKSRLHGFEPRFMALADQI